MKTLITLLAIFLTAHILVAQTECEAVITNSSTQNTVVFTGSYYENGQLITEPALVDYVWQLNGITLNGQTITYTFTQNGVYVICLTATGPNCTASTCDSIYIGNSTNPCDMTLTYDITHCTNANTADGAIDITVTGGALPYSFYWDNQQTTEDITGLLPGVYTVAINDNENCSLTWSFYVGTENNTDTTTNPNDTVFNDLYVNLFYYFETNLDCSATVYPEVYGGTPPYSYSWSNQSSAASLTNVCGNEYYCITVTDSEAQTASACVYIQYYNYGQDTIWDVNDTLGVVINECFENLVFAEVISYEIQGEYIIVVWAFTDDQNAITYMTVTYTLNSIISEGVYILNLYVNCTGYKSLSVYTDQILVTSEDITDIDDIKSKTGLNLYPNPVSDILNLELFTETNEIIEISILNISGQIVSKETYEIYGGLNNFTIDVSDYQGGMYFMHINGSSKFETIRFVK
ncbi:MAG: T9SS type A sorting domain-containing protein [Bacteroidales bacterium]|nr:T9SS type A sorting domain-containing protein [Bacteroidales bacterium]